MVHQGGEPSNLPVTAACKEALPVANIPPWELHHPVQSLVAAPGSRCLGMGVVIGICLCMEFFGHRSYPPEVYTAVQLMHIALWIAVCIYWEPVRVAVGRERAP